MSVINQMLRDLDRRTMPADRTVYAARIERDSSRLFSWRHWVIASLVIAGGIALSMAIAGWKGSTVLAVASNIETAPVAASATSAIVAPAIPEAARYAIPAPPVEASAAEIDVAQETAKSRATRIAAPKPSTPAPNTKTTERQAAPRQHAINQPTALAALSVKTPVIAKAADPSLAPASEPPLAKKSPAMQADKRIVRSEPTRTADSEYRHAVALMDQGRIKEAQQRLRNALDMNARHAAARQALAALLLEGRSYDAAAKVLSAGLEQNPAQTNFAVALSRLHLEQGNMPAAIGVLRAHASYAVGHPEYRAFAAALYSKSGAHAKAIAEYEAALKLAPQMGPWWIGLALAHEAEDHADAATDAYGKARATGTLSASLNQFIERKLQRKE